MHFKDIDNWIDKYANDLVKKNHKKLMKFLESVVVDLKKENPNLEWEFIEEIVNGFIEKLSTRLSYEYHMEIYQDLQEKEIWGKCHPWDCKNCPQSCKLNEKSQYSVFGGKVMGIFGRKKKVEPLSVENIVEMVETLAKTVKEKAAELVELEATKEVAKSVSSEMHNQKMAAINKEMQDEISRFNTVIEGLDADLAKVARAKNVLHKLIEVFALDQ